MSSNLFGNRNNRRSSRPRKRMTLSKQAASFFAAMLLIVFVFAFDIINVGELTSLVEDIFGSSDNLSDFESGEDLVIRYFDVGQTDSILIQLPNSKNMLIDAGNDMTAQYLEEYGISTIDYMVMTHPHADHISGMPEIIENFTVKNAYMPRIASSDLPTTKVFTRFLSSVKDRKVNLREYTSSNTIFVFEELNLKAETLAPNGKEYDDLNDYSLVVRLQYGDNVFIFSGDAENKSEKEIMKKYDSSYLKADVLQCGHHGSKSSTSSEYLSVIKPTYAIMSVGEDNKYGHPTPEVLKRLKKINATIYRTDINGTITCISDGNEITFETEK